MHPHACSRPVAQCGAHPPCMRGACCQGYPRCRVYRAAALGMAYPVCTVSACPDSHVIIVVFGFAVEALCCSRRVHFLYTMLATGMEQACRLLCAMHRSSAMAHAGVQRACRIHATPEAPCVTHPPHGCRACRMHAAFVARCIAHPPRMARSCRLHGDVSCMQLCF